MVCIRQVREVWSLYFISMVDEHFEERSVVIQASIAVAPGIPITQLFPLGVGLALVGSRPLFLRS